MAQTDSQPPQGKGLGNFQDNNQHADQYSVALQFDQASVYHQLHRAESLELIQQSII